MANIHSGRFGSVENAAYRGSKPANILPEFPLARHTARVMVAGIAAALSFQSKVHMAFHSPPSQSSTRGSRKLLAGLSGVWAALAAVATAAAQAPAAQAPADLALLHGRIHTEDAGRSVVQALAVRGNTIVAVGADQAVTALIGPQTRVVDLHGRVVLPGLIDAHTHPADGARDLGKCNLGDVMLTTATLKEKVAGCRRKSPGESWLEVIQVNPSGLTLTLKDLDSMLAIRPLILVGSDGHSAWANSAALAAAHLSATTQDPGGGRIERDAAGNPTGTLRDDAMDLVLDAMPRQNLERDAEQLAGVLDAMRATGITSVQDASVDETLMQMYKRLYDQHRLNMRVRGCFHLRDLYQPAQPLIDRAVAFRSRWAIDPDFLRADAVKIFADGVIEYPSQTAALLEPYLDGHGHATDNRGPSYFTQENLDQIVSDADAAGLTVHVHAIGDRAVRASLDAFAFSRRKNGAGDGRDQIAHLELIDPSDFPRFKELGVIANFQLLWAERDPYIVNATLPYIGPERSRDLYPARSLRDAGAMIAGGSDWNVSSFDAFEAMEHAVTRAQARGQPPLLPEQSITIQDAVDAYTINAAFALKQEKTTGSLEPGKRADMIIIDRDVFSIDPGELHATRVLSTYLDGREVYSRRGSNGAT
jgi:predicted amidohydrolase YtcJ